MNARDRFRQSDWQLLSQPDIRRIESERPGLVACCWKPNAASWGKCTVREVSAVRRVRPGAAIRERPEKDQVSGLAGFGGQRSGEYRCSASNAGSLLYHAQLVSNALTEVWQLLIPRSWQLALHKPYFRSHSRGKNCEQCARYRSKKHLIRDITSEDSHSITVAKCFVVPGLNPIFNLRRLLDGLR